MTARTVTTREKVPTPFGNLYLDIQWDGPGADAKAIGGAISSPGKNPDGTVEKMLEALSDTLNAMLREGI